MSQATLPPPRKLLKELWQEIDKLDISNITTRCGASMQDHIIKLSAIGQNYNIDCQNKTITNAETNEPAHFLLQLVIIHYFINAQDIPLKNKLANPLELVGGDFFFRGPHTFKLEPLEQKLASKETFLKAGLKLGATLLDLGDACFTITALPHVPVTYILWCADEDFPAKINVLFDTTADKQLPLDMLWALVNLTNKELMKD